MHGPARILCSMDAWDIVTRSDCRHEGNIEVQPGRTENDPVDAYCAICGEKVDLGGMTWASYMVEVEFNRWAASQPREPG